jgi:hypothetical protein
MIALPIHQQSAILNEFAHSFSHPDRRVTYLPMSPVMSAIGTKRT